MYRSFTHTYTQIAYTHTCILINIHAQIYNPTYTQIIHIHTYTQIIYAHAHILVNTQSHNIHSYIHINNIQSHTLTSKRTRTNTDHNISYTTYTHTFNHEHLSVPHQKKKIRDILSYII